MLGDPGEEIAAALLLRVRCPQVRSALGAGTGLSAGPGVNAKRKNEAAALEATGEVSHAVKRDRRAELGPWGGGGLTPPFHPGFETFLA